MGVSVRGWRKCFSLYDGHVSCSINCFFYLVISDSKCWTIDQENVNAIVLLTVARLFSIRQQVN